MKTLEQELEAAMIGEDSNIIIYWDEQDSKNVGPAWRHKTENMSGSLDFDGWSSDVFDGYFLIHYFLLNGCYRGPDCHGIYPIFSF